VTQAGIELGGIWGGDFAEAPNIGLWIVGMEHATQWVTIISFSKLK
jgi:hypothetical protein